jgi:hypothetical protein
MSSLNSSDPEKAEWKAPINPISGTRHPNYKKGHQSPDNEYGKNYSPKKENLAPFFVHRFQNMGVIMALSTELTISKTIRPKIIIIDVSILSYSRNKGLPSHFVKILSADSG